MTTTGEPPGRSSSARNARPATGGVPRARNRSAVARTANDPFRLAVAAAERQRRFAVHGRGAEGVLPGPPVGEVGVGHRHRHARLVRERVGDRDQAIRLGVRQRLAQQAVDECEHRHVSADAEGEREDGAGGEGRAPMQCAGGVPQVGDLGLQFGYWTNARPLPVAFVPGTELARSRRGPGGRRAGGCATCPGCGCSYLLDAVRRAPAEAAATGARRHTSYVRHCRDGRRGGVMVHPAVWMVSLVVAVSLRSRRRPARRRRRRKR